MHNGILLSHKKECIWVSSNEVDDPRACSREWSKSEREKQISYINSHTWNLNYFWSAVLAENLRFFYQTQRWMFCLFLISIMSICYYCSVGNPCLILCDSMNSSIPGSFISSLSPRVCSNSCPWSWWRESASLVAQAVENPPAMRDTCVQPLGWEDPLEKGMATHSSMLPLKISWMK